mmetsp:Transcript_32092/g.80568  ORF Transcript_32092/g.80568 Transcript_32092/m.80568 type:complete len:440 (+) Transcript_32092:62-1381(+)
MALLKSSPSKLYNFLKHNGLSRAALFKDNLESGVGKFLPSNPVLTPLADEVNSLSDHADHEGVYLQISKQSTSTIFGAFIHRSVRGQGCGGIRFWPYDLSEGFFRDGLRLSRGMSRKSALAGLWWGGGKGVVIRDKDHDWSDPLMRMTLFQEYGEFITSLQGLYVAAEDVGMTSNDLGSVFSTSRFATCIPPQLGGSGNPSPATAMGVICAAEAAFRFLDGSTLEGKTVAMEGGGNVSFPMMQELLRKGVRHITATDIDADRLELIQQAFPGDARLELRLVKPGDHSIYEEEAELVMPNALGGTLNPTTIPLLRTRVVCGAANNQLLDEARDAKLLAQRGITYVPDFVANRMGIVNCANEQYGYVANDDAITRHYGTAWNHSIPNITTSVLERAKTHGVTTAEAAEALADEYIKTPHPIFPHRGADIARTLRDSWGRTK